ncbi:putative Diaminopimelate decarboxylase [Paratrimastix pyriformis]|uniref:Diaminopimelate decarboxylase n=2 Tax=Paratrimastix pyriformis TaxID=342808 RepID=A0ABQ8UP92_9EUKA|nr:putative Diaminopimelate decarboxylase [Paratrimastix pyriformis]
MLGRVLLLLFLFGLHRASAADIDYCTPAPVGSYVEPLRFLTAEKAQYIAQAFGTPIYVYSMDKLQTQAQAALNFPNAYGLTVRFAMKSSSNAAILQTFHKMGLNIDASSVTEIARAVRAGFAPDQISLSTQDLADGFEEWVEKGVKINACSLDQLERYGRAFPGTSIGVRFNPGIGSGGTNKTNVGGPASSFGIWYEWMPQVKALLAKYSLTCNRVHTHIGSGSDPAVWVRAANLTLGLVAQLPDVSTVNLGGGYKVARVATEHSTDLQVVGKPVRDAFVEFYRNYGRMLHLEIEPGTFLLANSASLITSVRDIVSTGSTGYNFVKLNAGYPEIIRPSLYGAQHPLVTIPSKPNPRVCSYVVVGHTCESGDLLTPLPNEGSALGARPMQEVQLGDLVVVEGVGAYCASMSTINYNSHLQAPEAMLLTDGKVALIRKKQTFEQLLQNEVPLP